jgi:hypothetical protein
MKPLAVDASTLGTGKSKVDRVAAHPVKNVASRTANADVSFRVGFFIVLSNW